MNQCRWISVVYSGYTRHTGHLIERARVSEECWLRVGPTHCNKVCWIEPLWLLLNYNVFQTKIRYTSDLPAVVSEQTNIISLKFQNNLHHKSYTHKSLICARFALNTVLRLAYVITFSQLFDKFITFSQVCQVRLTRTATLHPLIELKSFFFLGELKTRTKTK